LIFKIENNRKIMKQKEKNNNFSENLEINVDKK
jgi:hypothetical protein